MSIRKVCAGTLMLLLALPGGARADFSLGSAPDALITALPGWIFTVFSALFASFFRSVFEPLIGAIDINGDGV
jgi:hypothetical protein